MKQRYRLIRRGNRSGAFYCVDTTTGKRTSLTTNNEDEADQIVQAKNQAERQPLVNLQIARAYLMAGDPMVATRTWQTVMDAIRKAKSGSTQTRWISALNDSALDSLRQLPVLETRAEHLLGALAKGTKSTNVYLRRLQNFALDMGWRPWPLLPRKLWPKVTFKPKRAITLDEHHQILAGERNPEWRAYYQMLWHTGGAQTDIATLSADNVDWNTKVISFHRRKTGSLVQLHFGKELEQILNDLPGDGALFPNLGRMKESDRASLFSRRCRLTRVSGVSLHCYRYAWAERAKIAGYPERFAQAALGHNSKAIHRAYARGALVKLPSLEDYELRQLKASLPAPSDSSGTNSDNAQAVADRSPARRARRDQTQQPPPMS